jgi:hypothetical protein
MPGRFVVALCALAVCLAYGMAVGCGGSQHPAGTAAASDGGARDGARDGAPVVPLFGGACPEDAPWTGTVCLGQGYVSCPGGYSMDDRSRCVRDAVAEAPDAARDDEEPDATERSSISPAP